MSEEAYRDILAFVMSNKFRERVVKCGAKRATITFEVVDGALSAVRVSDEMRAGREFSRADLVSSCK